MTKKTVSTGTFLYAISFDLFKFLSHALLVMNGAGKDMFCNEIIMYMYLFFAPKARFRKDWLHTVVGFEFVSCNGSAVLFGEGQKNDKNPPGLSEHGFLMTCDDTFDLYLWISRASTFGW